MFLHRTIELTGAASVLGGLPEAAYHIRLVSVEHSGAPWSSWLCIGTKGLQEIRFEPQPWYHTDEQTQQYSKRDHSPGSCEQLVAKSETPG